MKTYYISILLLSLLALCIGCSNNTVTQNFNFNEHLNVINQANTMSKEAAIATVNAVLTVNNYKADTNGIFAEQQITKPAERPPALLPRHGDSYPSGLEQISPKTQVVPEKEMSVAVFLAFDEISRIGIVTNKSKTAHKIGIFDKNEKYTSVMVSDNELNHFLAALYTLCPNLSQ